ncbi:exported protein (hyp5) [Plasmodium gaboni]|uniref:Exported protein (Hyp5) n=1 Tax=Plasmodium gaboni TaxID=647221 RepID=A0A151LLB8_9APIC|nr:exported protein (hyp5) [Plasmodium gaboni]KYO00001.1 exported protein (hyp5) [Plasmodium gaboni]
MLFPSFKLFIFILVLNIILGFNKKNNFINIFVKNNNNKPFLIRINKSLAEYIKNEKRNYERTEFDLLYKELVEEKLKNYQKLMDLRKKDKNYEKKRRRDKKWQDKVVRSKMRAYYLFIGNYNKYYEMNDSFNLIGKKNEIKNKLYEIIFNGTSFWKGLGNFLELLGICAVESMFVAIFNAIVLLLQYVDGISMVCATYAIMSAGMYGVFILLIIITVVVVVLLVVWLWPKDDENAINKILEPNLTNKEFLF